MKVFREERERAVMLCVDAGPHMHFGTRGTFKNVQAARAAALLGWAAMNAQDRVGAILFGDPETGLLHFQPSRARLAFWRMLRALAATSEAGAVAGDPLVDALEKLARAAPTGALILVVADLTRDPASLQAPLGRLTQRHEVVLVPVDDPADRDLADLGRVVFRTHAGVRIEVDTRGERGRQHYRATWGHRREALLTLGRRLGTTVIPVTTDGDLELMLAQGLRQRTHLRVRAAVA
jgi:uncharacterized protein (DUF58 family)